MDIGSTTSGFPVPTLMTCSNLRSGDHPNTCHFKPIATAEWLKADLKGCINVVKLSASRRTNDDMSVADA
jgi:hypothetical protein